MIKYYLSQDEVNKNFWKKLLTKKNGFDKMKKLKQAKNFEN